MLSPDLRAIHGFVYIILKPICWIWNLNLHFGKYDSFLLDIVGQLKLLNISQPGLAQNSFIMYYLCLKRSREIDGSKMTSLVGPYVPHIFVSRAVKNTKRRWHHFQSLPNPLDQLINFPTFQ